MSRLPLPSLRAFEAAARHASFVKAATELNLTAAGVSQHVRALEDWLGVPLFSRHHRGVALTAAGRELGEAVRHGLMHMETAAQQLKRAGQIRPVSVACIPSVATRWLIPRLPQFRAAHPEIRINIVYALDAKTPEAAGADILIRHGPKPTMPAIELLDAWTRPTCSPEFLETHGPFDQPEALIGAELLHDETVEAWDRWFAEANVRAVPKAGHVFADFTLMFGSVIGGQGVGLCPTTLIRDEIASGALVTLFEIASDRQKAYWLLEAQGLSGEAAILRNWLLATRD
jgi:LysR family transcriptional regulator, glycine cleavage system transcriptional activator